jgi:hypothetical protein
MLSYMKLGLDAMGSVQCLAGILGLVVSELVSRPYEMKIEGLEMLQSLVKSSPELLVRNGMEGGYPIQVFLFSLYHYENEVYKGIRDWFRFESIDV